MPQSLGIQFNEVSLTYGSDAEGTQALRSITFEADPGTSIALIGPSGCGKSSTLGMVAGLLEPSAGEVLVGGSPVAGPNQSIAYIPQNLGLFPWKTVIQNAMVGLSIRKVPAKEARERGRAALREVGLEGFEDAYPRELSGGMRQRLALARAIAIDAGVLLMDEPLSAIDALLREQLQDMLLELWRRERYTQVLVTHSIDEAVCLGQRIVVLSGRPGRIVAEVENPGMGERDYRNSVEFARMCKLVRLHLDEGSRASIGTASSPIDAGFGRGPEEGALGYLGFEDGNGGAR